MSDMLNVKGLSISFGGLKAVNNFAINIEKGQLYGLIGPNGAGKTTIFNLLTGVYKPDTGTILLDGQNLTGKSTTDINKAGIAWFGLLTDMTDNDWDKILATNLSSVFYCSRAAIPYMVSKKCGKILNISSMWGTVGASCEVAYSATKSGIHGLTRALAKELAPSNIQVNAIACGVIDTEMNGRLNEEERQDLIDEIPSGRFADPEEVAELALKLTDTPAYMTGQILGIDGGFI